MCAAGQQYEVSPRTASADRVCRDYTAQCSHGEYKVADATATSDIVCTTHTSCAADSYESAAPTHEYDRVCRTLSACSSSEWERVAHPQLGGVEVGGWLEFKHNPLLCILPPIMKATTEFVLDHARRQPKVSVTALAVTPLSIPGPITTTPGEAAAAAGGEPCCFKVTASVMNEGQMATTVTNKGKDLGRFPPVTLRLRPSTAAGVRILPSGVETVTIGHLEPQMSGRAEWLLHVPCSANPSDKQQQRQQMVIGVLEVKGAAGGDSTLAVRLPAA